MTPRQSPVVVLAADVAPQAWRNGGGQTRELLAWPGARDWTLRISRADITQDGPFSAFADVQRWFAVLHGAGVDLVFADRTRTLRPGDDPIRFDGASAPMCRLLDGPTLDLNLMARGGDARMAQVDPNHSWDDTHPVRALYTCVPGRWRGGARSQALAAHSLLWSDAADADGWTFVPDQPVARPLAWWLAYSPDA